MLRKMPGGVCLPQDSQHNLDVIHPGGEPVAFPFYIDGSRQRESCDFSGEPATPFIVVLPSFSVVRATARMGGEPRLREERLSQGQIEGRQLE